MPDNVWRGRLSRSGGTRDRWQKGHTSLRLWQAPTVRRDPLTNHSLITSTMQDDFQLTITAILRHGATVHGRSECVTWLGDGAARTSVTPRPPGTRNGWQPPWPRWGSAPATGSARSAGTTRRTWRRTTPCRAWARCCTPSTSGSPPRRSPTSSTTRKTGPSSSTGRCCRCSRRRCRGFPPPRRSSWSARGTPRSSALPARAALRASSWPPPGTRLPLARPGREIGRAHLLHQRHHRRPQGSGVLAPLDVPARAVRPGRDADRPHRPRQDPHFVPMFHVNAWGIPFGRSCRGRRCTCQGRS